jgi:hypothetical protein
MDSEIHLQIYLLSDYQPEVWPLPQDKIDMQVQVRVPAHPFYSDWNSLSPFKMQLPHLQTKLAYLKGYQWEVQIEDGVRVVQQLMPL